MTARGDDGIFKLTWSCQSSTCQAFCKSGDNWKLVTDTVRLASSTRPSAGSSRAQVPDVLPALASQIDADAAVVGARDSNQGVHVDRHGVDDDEATCDAATSATRR